MKPTTDMDYVELYAKKLSENNSIFEQHRKFINDRFRSSSILFRNMFGTGEEFKTNAREYLRKTGILK